MLPRRDLTGLICLVLPQPRGYAFTFFVCLVAGLFKIYSTDFHEIRWKRGT